MYLGNIVEFGSKKSIFENTLHPYTKALFSAVPVPNPHVKMNRIMLKGDIPSPVNPPKGCKFHTRCEHCMDICSRAVPEYREVEAGHFCACHLYNSKEDTERLLAKAYEDEQIAASIAEKDAQKPWNRFKVKAVGLKDKCVDGIVNLFHGKKKDESGAESAPKEDFADGTVVKKTTTVTTVETYTSIETVGEKAGGESDTPVKDNTGYSVTTKTEEQVVAVSEPEAKKPATRASKKKTDGKKE